MPTYRSRLLTRGAPQLPPPSAVPLQATDREHVHRALVGLDTLPSSGARMLFEWGLAGDTSFLVPNGTAMGGGAQIYPDKSTPRVIGRVSSVPLTPGHFVELNLVAVPSGPFTRPDGFPVTYIYDGAGGSVRMVVSYTNSDAQTIEVTSEVNIPASLEVNAAEPPSCYGQLLTRTAVAIPAPLVPSAGEWEKWTRGADVLVDVVISYIGSPRVVDGYISERPHSIIVDNADAAWPSAMYAFNSVAYLQFPSDYPIEQLSSTDPGGGYKAIARALAQHGNQLGPALFGWAAWTEASGNINDWVSYNGGTGDDEGPGYTVTGTTPTLVPFGATVDDPAYPGWSMANYARPADHSDHFLDGRIGVIPVWVYARVKVSAGTGHFSVITVPKWSEIRFTTTSTTWVDVLTPGWLECGIGPEDDKPAKLWAYNSGANNTSIRYLACFHRPR